MGVRQTPSRFTILTDSFLFERFWYRLAQKRSKIWQPTMPHSNRIASLDGFRALAIAMVTLAHLYPKADALGAPGVDVFFVISGFLITHLLIREREANGSFSIKNFYIRRARRIFPAYALFLLVATALISLKLMDANRAQLLEAATYTYSVVPHTAKSAIGQVWSLCVEEHFYLLWPLTLLLLGFARSRYALIAVIIVTVPLRFLLRNTTLDIGYSTPTRLDVIAVGCLAAYAWNSQRLRHLVKRTMSYRVLWSAIGLWLLSHFVLSHSGKFALCVASAFEAVCIAVIMFHCIQRKTTLLNWKPIVFVGVLSYSIYLAQTLLFVKGIHGNLLLQLLAISCYALFSYYLVEAPVLNYFKDKNRTVIPAPALSADSSGQPPVQELTLS